MNLGSHASYSHDGRDQLPTDLVVTHPIKTLRGVWQRLDLKPKIGIEMNPKKSATNTQTEQSGETADTASFKYGYHDLTNLLETRRFSIAVLFTERLNAIKIAITMDKLVEML
jgi:hypothetical protein